MNAPAATTDEQIHPALAQAQQQSAVAALGVRALQTRATLEELFTDACDCLARILGVEFSSVLELVPTKHLMLRAGRGWDESRLGAGLLFVAEQPEGSIDLLVTDIVMPKLSGLELRDRVVGRWPALKVLFISGYPDEAVARHGLLEPTASFLSKPFSAHALLARVQALLAP